MQRNKKITNGKWKSRPLDLAKWAGCLVNNKKTAGDRPNLSTFLESNGAYPVNIKSPLELSGAIPVILQDQTTRPLIVKFNEVSDSTDLSIPAVKGAYEITPTSTTGFVDGKYIILFHPASENFSFYTQIGAPAAGIITLDTPIDFAYPAGTFVDAAITNMGVNGSGTPRVFGLRGTGAPPGIDTMVDITRLIFHCVAPGAVDLATFASLTALTRGLVLRRRDGMIQNIFNVKTNGEIAGIMFNHNITIAGNPAQGGVDGFISRLTFAGQNKIGVALRLPIGEDIEILVQDPLQTITLLEVIAEGHIVTD